MPIALAFPDDEPEREPRITTWSAVAGRIAAGAVTTSALGADAVRTGTIAANTVTVRQMGRSDDGR